MNDAHLHMVVNHFPIIGTIFGLGILLAGIFMKNSNVNDCLLVNEHNRVAEAISSNVFIKPIPLIK